MAASDTQPSEPRSAAHHIYVSSDVTEYIQKHATRSTRSLIDKDRGQAYAILLRPRWYIDGEGCVIQRVSADSYKVMRKDGSEESAVLGRPLADGSIVITPKMMDSIYKHVQRGWSLGDIKRIPGETGLLQDSKESPPNRVIVVVPLLPENIETCAAIANTTIGGIHDSIAASILFVEVEPGEIFRDDTRIIAGAQMGIDIARNEFAKADDSPEVVRSVLVPTADTMRGVFSPEELGKMLYDAAINREKNSGWTLSSRGEPSGDVVRLAGFTGRTQRSSLYATGDAMEIHGVRTISVRIRLLGGDSYPNSEYALYPKQPGSLLRLGDSEDSTIHSQFEKAFKKIKARIPYKVTCYSSFYRMAILSSAYRCLRKETASKSGEEKIKKRAIVFFKKLLRIGTENEEVVCGTPVSTDDIPGDVTDEGLVSGTEGRTRFTKHHGYVVTMDGTDSWVVVGEDPVNGISVVLPDPETQLSLAREYRVVPSSYLYRYKTSPTRKVLLPGKGANEYLCVWEYGKALTDKSPIPVVMERCFFIDSAGLPAWKSVDGRWSLRFQKISGYSGWVLSKTTESGDVTDMRHDDGPLAGSGSLNGSWCGTYGPYTVAMKIGNPLMAIAAMELQGMASPETMAAHALAGDEADGGSLRPETAHAVLRLPMDEVRVNTPCRMMSRAYTKTIAELEKNGVLEKGGGQTIYQKYATEENTLASLRSFSKAAIPHLETLYCQRMMMFAKYPAQLTGSHRGIRDTSNHHKGLLDAFRAIYKTYGFATLCSPSVCSSVASQVFRAPKPRARSEVRLAVDAPIMAYRNADIQANRSAGFLRASTNPEYGAMNQFVTFAANESQLMSMVVNPWHAGGAPTWKPVVVRESGNAEQKAIYRAIRRCTELPMYQDLGPMDVIRGIQYGFHRLRVSLFVSIRNGAMVVFAPMVKADYSNYLPRSDEFWFGSVSPEDYLSAKNRFMRAVGKRTEKYDPRSRWFVNNSLVGNMVSKSLTSDQTIPVVLEMLRETVLYEQLNDCDFMINTRDFPKLRVDGKDPDHAAHGLPVEKSVDMPGFENAKHLPVLGFNVHPQYADIPIPVPDDWKNAYGGYYGKDERGSVSPNIPHPIPITAEQWALRSPRAVFRGGATGVSSVAPMNQRVLLAEMSEDLRKNAAERGGMSVGDVELDDLDVELVSAAIRDKKVASTGMEYIVPSGSSAGNVNTKAVIREDQKMPLRTPLVEKTTASGKRTRGFQAPDAYTAQDRNQMVIYVDGNAAAYRYSSLMAAGFVILRVASRVGYDMWFYPALVNALPGSDSPPAAGSDDAAERPIDDSRFNPAGDHIQIDPDMKNLQRVIRWVGENPEKAIQIAENSVRKYTRLFHKTSLRGVLAGAINLASNGQTWKKPIASDKLSGVRLVEEPREARAYRNALRLSEKRQADRDRVATAVAMSAAADVVSDSVRHTQMTTQDAPTEGYEREDAPGEIALASDDLARGREFVEDTESIDTLHTTTLPYQETPLRKPSVVLRKYTHGALRRQVLRFAGEGEGDDVYGYETEEDGEES